MRIMLPERLKKALRAALPDAGVFYIGLGTRCFLVETGGRSYVLKERFDRAFRNERRTHEFLMAKKFPHAPAYHGVFFSEGRRYLVFDYIAGENLRYCRLDPRRLKDLLGVLAAFHGLQAGKPCSSARVLRVLLDRTARQKRMVMAAVRVNRSVTVLRAARQLDLLWRQLEDAGEVLMARSAAVVRPVLLHTELDFRLGIDGRLYMIDMEDFIIGDPVWDLAGVSRAFTGVSAQAVLSAYTRYVPLDKEAGERFKLYQMLLAYLWLVSLLMEVMCISRGRSAVGGDREQAFQRAFMSGVERLAAELK